MAATLIRKKSFLSCFSLHSNVRTFYGNKKPKFDIGNSKMMKKILRKANRKKDVKWAAPIYGQTPAPDVSHWGKPVKSKQRFSDGMKRRADHIGDVLYDTVSTVISSGELGVQANILKVQVIPDLSYMNIYWEASGNKETDDRTELNLNKNANNLIQILIQTNQLGCVPKPVFVKDMSLSKQKEIEDLLFQVKLQMEKELPDHEHDGSNLDEETVFLYSNSDEYHSDFEVVNANESESDLYLKSNDKSVSENIELDFRQNLYDVPHDELMSKVVAAKVSANKRPTIESNTSIKSDQYVRFDKELKKVLTQKQKVSKRKILQQTEQQELLNYELETNQSDELDEYTEKDEVTKDNPGVDTWMKRYHQDLSDSK